MMKHITSFKSLLSMMVMLVMGNITAAADNKVYISDFSIAADEEVEIAINFDRRECIRCKSVDKG